MYLLMIVILVVILLGGLPVHSYSREWGYGPSGLIGIVLIVLVVLVLSGRLR